MQRSVTIPAFGQRGLKQDISDFWHAVLEPMDNLLLHMQQKVVQADLVTNAG